MAKTIINRYNCPKRIWNKFSIHQAVIYNEMYEDFNQSLFFPPEWSKDKDKIEVVAHNMACETAWMLGIK